VNSAAVPSFSEVSVKFPPVTAYLQPRGNRFFSISWKARCSAATANIGWFCRKPLLASSAPVSRLASHKPGTPVIPLFFLSSFEHDGGSQYSIKITVCMNESWRI
jgi:hypothetical protein